MDAIFVSNLRKLFGKKAAVDGVSFTVPRGQIFGFLGPNGAGKTTTIRCMMDFIRPTAGTIAIMGKDAQKESVAVKQHVGYLSGSVRLHSKWTGQEHIDFYRATNPGSNDVAPTLCERFSLDPSIQFHHLSSGNKQKLGIVLAFMFQPDVLILDEPTNALDPLLQNEVYGLLREATKRGSTVFMSSHNLAEVDRTCDRVGIIRDGKMVAIETIQSLKDKRMHIVHATFTKSVDPKHLVFDGGEVVQAHDDHVTINVKGDLNGVVRALGQYDLRDLSIDHAPLEDIFLEFYSAK
jgi:ABC-2 type transport system ATP-binding protein